MSGTGPPPASDIPVSPIPGLSATNVQDALAELQVAKQSVPGPQPPSVNAHVQPNPNVPQIDQPQADVAALRTVVAQIRQGVQSLAGNRGGEYDRAVTLQDLIDLGLTTASACVARLGRTSSPPPPGGPGARSMRMPYRRAQP
jgi:hypothetical protein